MWCWTEWQPQSPFTFIMGEKKMEWKYASALNISFCVPKEKVNQFYGFITTWEWINDYFHFGENFPFNANCRRWRSLSPPLIKAFYCFIHEENIELKDHRSPMLSICVSDNEHIFKHKLVQEKCAIFAADVPLKLYSLSMKLFQAVALNYFMLQQEYNI